MTKEELTKLRQERRKQVLNIGDRVIAHSASDKPLYDGKTATIIEKGMIGNDVYYGLYIEGVTVEKRSTPIIGECEIIGNTSLLAPFYAEDLELAKEPTDADKRDAEVDETAELERVKTNCKELYEAGMNFSRAFGGDEEVKEDALRIVIAKAVAVAYAEKGRYEPSEIGAKAVEVANGVVNELKNNKK